jgi:hypothetical protein
VAVRAVINDEGLAAIRRLAATFEACGIEYWLFGGWAVDLHAGRVTREHADIDIAIWKSDLKAVGEILETDGWIATASSADDGYATFTRGSVDLDLALLALDADGTVYTPSAVGRGEWPPACFGDDVRELGGIRAHVVSLRCLISDKGEIREDVVTATKDAADLDVLRSVAEG